MLDSTKINKIYQYIETILIFCVIIATHFSQWIQHDFFTLSKILISQRQFLPVLGLLLDPSLIPVVLDSLRSQMIIEVPDYTFIGEIKWGIMGIFIAFYIFNFFINRKSLIISWHGMIINYLYLFVLTTNKLVTSENMVKFNFTMTLIVLIYYSILLYTNQCTLMESIVPLFGIFPLIATLQSDYTFFELNPSVNIILVVICGVIISLVSFIYIFRKLVQCILVITDKSIEIIVINDD